MPLSYSIDADTNLITVRVSDRITPIDQDWLLLALTSDPKVEVGMGLLADWSQAEPAFDTSALRGMALVCKRLTWRGVTRVALVRPEDERGAELADEYAEIVNPAEQTIRVFDTADEARNWLAGQ